MASNPSLSLPPVDWARVRAVSVDFTGTLAEPWPSVGAIYAEGLARLTGVQVPAAELDRAFYAAFRAATAKPRPRLDDAAERAFWRGVVAATLGVHCPPERFEAVFAELWEAFARPSCWRVLPGAAAWLDFCRTRGWPLALLSNGDARFRTALHGLGLAAPFDHLILSSEDGEEKPAAGIFQRTAARLGVPIAHLLHVGDSPRQDAQGAVAAGAQAVLVHQPGSPTLAELVATLPAPPA